MGEQSLKLFITFFCLRTTAPSPVQPCRNFFLFFSRQGWASFAATTGPRKAACGECGWRQRPVAGKPFVPPTVKPDLSVDGFGNCDCRIILDLVGHRIEAVNNDASAGREVGLVSIVEMSV